MEGINTKKLVVNPEEAANIRLMFEMYADPATSYGDITRYFCGTGDFVLRQGTDTPHAGADVTQPCAYVQADLDVYEFSKVRGRCLSMTPPTLRA